jgi:hypothetical protein
MMYIQGDRCYIFTVVNTQTMSRRIVVDAFWRLVTILCAMPHKAGARKTCTICHGNEFYKRELIESTSLI